MSVSGTVLQFDEVKGYGFVSLDTGGDDVFVHVNDLTFDKRLLTQGSRVQFSLEEGDRGPKASRVALVEPGRSPATGGPGGSGGSAGSGVPAVTVARTVPVDDDTCEVLAVDEYTRAVTEAMLESCPSLTAEQLLQIRRPIVRIAQSHGWLE